MAREKGDTNYTPREKRLIAQNNVLKAEIGTIKEKLKVKDARIKELRGKLGNS